VVGNIAESLAEDLGPVASEKHRRSIFPIRGWQL